MTKVILDIKTIEGVLNFDVKIDPPITNEDLEKAKDTPLEQELFAAAEISNVIINHINQKIATAKQIMESIDQKAKDIIEAGGEIGNA